MNFTRKCQFFSELTKMDINRVNAICLNSSVEMEKVHTSVTFKCDEIHRNSLTDASAAIIIHTFALIAFACFTNPTPISLDVICVLTEDLPILCRKLKIFKSISMLVIRAPQA